MTESNQTSNEVVHPCRHGNEAVLCIPCHRAEIVRLTADLSSANEQLANQTARWGTVVDERDLLRAALDGALAEVHHHFGCDSECEKRHAGAADETTAALPIPSGWRGIKPWFKVGDEVIPRQALFGRRPTCTVTEITSEGFKYSHEKIPTGSPLWGVCEGGETYEPSGYQSIDDYRSEVIRGTQAASR